jgi:small multidrug resistance family-3 protein
MLDEWTRPSSQPRAASRQSVREGRDFCAPRMHRQGSENELQPLSYTIPGPRKGTLSCEVPILVEKDRCSGLGPSRGKAKHIVLVVKTTALFVVTALAEIIGCYLTCLWLQKNGSAWLLVPAAMSLGLFAVLLTLHPAASGRIYASYGGIYVVTALVWLRFVDGIAPGLRDWIGAGLIVAGMGVIVSGWKPQ